VLSWEFLGQNSCCLFQAKRLKAGSGLRLEVGHAHTEVWNATEWAKFKDLIRNLPEEGE
jgi:hypothetical protein